MRSKLYILIILFIIPSAYGCFTNTDCPRYSTCYKTGNIMGMCLPTGNSIIYTPGSTNSVTPWPTPGAGVSNTGTTQVPMVQYNQPAVTAGTCTDNINCQSGFVCSRPNYNLVGVCTQVNQ